MTGDAGEVHGAEARGDEGEARGGDEGEARGGDEGEIRGADEGEIRGADEGEIRGADEGEIRGGLDGLLDTLPVLNDGDVMALAGFRSGEDADALAAARARAEAAVAAGGREAELASARAIVERWAEKTGGGETSAFLGGTDGLRRIGLRLEAAPAVFDAALAFVAGGDLSDEDAVLLGAAWAEVALGDEGDADLDALAEAAGADPDDPSGARI